MTSLQPRMYDVNIIVNMLEYPYDSVSEETAYSDAPDGNDARR